MVSILLLNMLLIRKVIIVKNKVLVELVVPDIDEIYNVYLPANRRIGNIILLLKKAITDLTNGVYDNQNDSFLYNVTTGEKYSINSLLRETDIRNGTSLVLFLLLIEIIPCSSLKSSIFKSMISVTFIPVA